jgi:hypothetical protein
VRGLSSTCGEAVAPQGIPARIRKADSDALTLARIVGATGPTIGRRREKPMFLSRLAAPAIAALGATLAVTGTASAQATAQVQFARGTSGATISGTIAGDEYIDYKLGAKGGQRMHVAMKVTASNGDGNAYFNILPPHSSGEAIYNGSTDGDSTTVRLPSDGEYMIRVYQMGADADGGKTTGFSIDVSIK